MKRIYNLILFVVMSLMFMGVATAPVFAVDCGAGASSSFLKLMSTWHEYLPKNDGTGGKPDNCEISDFKVPDDIWKVALAVVDIILRFAGIIAFGAVIKAGFSFVLSRGNPTEAAKARQSIIDALIGVAITSVAVLLVAFLGRTLTQ